VRKPLDQLPAVTVGTVLRDNASDGARLVVTYAVIQDRVYATCRRTGRRTAFDLGRVDGSGRGYTIVPPAELDEAMKRMREARLGDLSNVVYLADRRGR
jgi:hypothetical protein